MNILYLTTMQIVDKWTMPIRDCGMILDNLMIYFADSANITPYMVWGNICEKEIILKTTQLPEQ